jgi:DNA uptake protein ComE-like DNA-binding protein
MGRVVVVIAVLIATATLAGAQAQMPKAAGDAMKAVTGPLDLNTASLDQREALPGVGEQYAKKIVDGRPFKQVDELMSKNVVPHQVFEQIKGLVAVKP